MRLAVVLIFSLACFGQARKTVFVVTDAEGVAGICRQDQTEPKNTELRQLLTGEVNAAVDGFYDGGAADVVVWDGHDGSQTLSATTIHPRARLLIGGLGLTMTFDRGYSALAFVGQHSRANTRAGIMAHSFSSLGIQNMLLNGKPVGEIDTVTALAGWFGIPVILLTGDRAACEELRAIAPEAVTAEVKEGLGRYTCVSLSATAARERIRAAAFDAMKKIGQVKPYKIDGPVIIQIEHTTRGSLAIDAGRAVGAEIVDDRTIRYRGKDFMEAWTRYRGR